MATQQHQANKHLEHLLKKYSLEQLKDRLSPKHDTPAHSIPRDPRITEKTVTQRWKTLDCDASVQQELLDERTQEQQAVYQRNIENFIGTVKLPVGIAGPLRVNGLFAQGDYYVPLATSEAALVASYSRGANLMTKAGGCTALLLNEGVSRAPGFAFKSLIDAGAFVAWTLGQIDEFKRLAEATTRFGKLQDMRVTVEGNHVYLNFEYLTGDASGQNMVTIATHAIFEYIKQASPVNIDYAFIEANLSGDKKACAQSFQSVRGKKVTAEVVISAELVKKTLHTTVTRMVDYWRMSALGGVLSGTIGVQGHYANGLAAFYIACGQDAACVSESSVGITRFEVTAEGDLYASVTLPNLIVGTVGGGTGLPSQRACLDIMGLGGQGKAQALAEVCASVSLAGELSIIGALCADHFASAHQSLARG
ncbi:Hydroxymethylglutaryl-CoA reductase [hydrothermal vent metagenome]|uniref:hydroxymethylglutaryl-CoA reductase (NADPH) n=1 Tax=hydrothermal vent metagenome TaxID=652676 RepID=A0A3B1B1I9_9ZZZZ